MTGSPPNGTATGAGAGDLTSRSVWEGLLGEDADGPYLVGGRCAACGFVTLGMRDVCPSCWARGSMTKTPIGRRGVLYTYTVIHQLPPGYAAPFAVGYVDLEGDIRVFAHLENEPESLRIGAALELTVAPLKQAEGAVWLVGPRYRAAGAARGGR